MSQKISNVKFVKSISTVAIIWNGIFYVCMEVLSNRAHFVTENFPVDMKSSLICGVNISIWFANRTEEREICIRYSRVDEHMNVIGVDIQGTQLIVSKAIWKLVKVFVFIYTSQSNVNYAKHGTQRSAILKFTCVAVIQYLNEKRHKQTDGKRNKKADGRQNSQW